MSVTLHHRATRNVTGCRSTSVERDTEPWPSLAPACPPFVALCASWAGATLLPTDHSGAV